MEIVKRLTKTESFQQLEQKLMRTQTTEEDMLKWQRRLRGFQGEKQFASLVEKHLTEGIVMFNLILSFNNKEFQIDALLLMQDDIYLFEVKNFSDDIFIKQHQFFM
ncbi:nuclease-related domain-containing protein [Macrococcus brunensis]|uniref:nuclease-related domain-containing protein n=1 Tax=Macrococcus brunensis TaxID=198483 RepID=UPI001EF09FD5|nr:nuclease-related domain-containing protein [Macrococcus brunensis]ULG73669.1 NERD domain-containing protein [Macrococcus brunensis]